MYDAARESQVTCNDDDAVLHDNRWRNILNSKEDRLLWRSIDNADKWIAKRQWYGLPYEL